MQEQLGNLLLNGWLITYNIDSSYIKRILDLMEKYRDRPMDFADASLVLLAEQTGCRQIFTLDSDFFFYRIGDRDSFEVLLPESS